MTTNFTNRVIPVSGEKIESMLATDSAFCFLSKKCNSVHEFEEAFGKTITLTTKTEVKYDAIKNIKKEANDDDVTIAYKGGIGGSSTTFSFNNASDCDAFLEYCTQNLGLTRNDVQISPFRAARNYMLGLLVTLVATPFLYNRAVSLATGVATDPDGYSKSARRERSLNNILETLGPNGVLIAGILIAGIIAFIIWKRYQNPPVQIQLTR
ncbi:MAG: hypothetical protein IPM98_14645 [Lewinellaceae bacterium]|nr:hypothetical protein [Lewinellaceae bacterium]